MSRESKSNTRAMENHIVQLKNKEQNTFTGMLVIIAVFVGICLYFVLGDNKTTKNAYQNEVSAPSKANQSQEKSNDKMPKQVNNK